MDRQTIKTTIMQEHCYKYKGKRNVCKWKICRYDMFFFLELFSPLGSSHGLTHSYGCLVVRIVRKVKKLKSYLEDQVYVLLLC